MARLDTSKLIRNISIIHHNLYKEGTFVNVEYGLVHVQFDYQTIGLSIYDYNRSWYVKNFNGYRLDDTKLLDSSREFENSFFNNTITTIIDEIGRTKSAISNLPDRSYGSEMAKIQKQLGRLETKKAALIKVRKSPYFARIDLIKRDEPSVGMTCYIRNVDGDNKATSVDLSLVDEMDNIVDWRSYEAKPYYDQEVYSNEESENKLVLRRNYEITNDKLLSYEDSLDSDKELIDQVADERLKRHIKNNRDKNIKNIVQTIKTNQYRIISHNQNRDILVHGCAGSGKTMILAHRLSFWMFRLKDQLDISDAMIISPTKLLSKEMTRLDLSINQAKFMSNREFNEYLINHICDQLSLDANIKETYLSNNLLDDAFIRRVYSKSQLEIFALTMQQLLDNDDEELLDEFENYSELVLNEAFNREFSSSKEIGQDNQKQYQVVYHKLKIMLDRLTRANLNEYRRKLENSNKDILEQSKRARVARSELRKQKDSLYQMVKEVEVTHPEYAKMDAAEIYIVNNEWKNSTNAIQSQLNDFPEVFDSFIEAKNELEEIESEYKRLMEQNNNSGVFGRWKRIQEIEKYREIIEATKIQIENTYRPWGLDFESSDENMNIIIDQMDNFLNNELAQCNRIQYVVNNCLEQEKKLSESEKVIENSSIDIDLVNKHLSVVNGLINSRKLVTESRHNNEDVTKIIDKILSVKIPNGISVINFLTRYTSYIESSEYIRINNYWADDDTDGILMIIIDFVIEKFKKDNSLDINNYEFEVFLKLFLLRRNATFTKITNKWLFIDEFQDYSYWEMDIYRKLFARTSFNYFGDMHQNINAKGLGEYELKLLKKNKFDLFEINENYRNAKEITDYVNSKFNLNMYSIGMNGEVYECDLHTFYTEIDLKAAKTTAIIVKDEILREQLKISKFKKDLAFIDDELQTIVTNKINVLTPLLVKGLEFDTVCVMESGMKDNEKYVCYTRALNKLIVIGESHDGNQ